MIEDRETEDISDQIGKGDLMGPTVSERGSVRFRYLRFLFGPKRFLRMLQKKKS